MKLRSCGSVGRMDVHEPRPGEPEEPRSARPAGENHRLPGGGQRRAERRGNRCGEDPQVARRRSRPVQHDHVAERERLQQLVVGQRRVVALHGDRHVRTAGRRLRVIARRFGAWPDSAPSPRSRYCVPICDVGPVIPGLSLPVSGPPDRITITATAIANDTATIATRSSSGHRRSPPASSAAAPKVARSVDGADPLPASRAWLGARARGGHELLDRGAELVGEHSRGRRARRSQH